MHKAPAGTRNSQERLPARASQLAKAAPPPVKSPQSVEQGTSTLPAKLLRFPDVRARTGLSRSTIWRLERRGDFPLHRRISPNAVAWLDEEVTAWIWGRVGKS